MALHRSIISWLCNDWRRFKARWRETIETDAAKRGLPCNHCGYDLTGTPDASRCPECGVAIDWDQSIWRDGRVHLAWAILLSGAGLIVAIGGGLAFLDVAAGQAHRYTIGGARYPITAFVALVLPMLIGGAMVCAGLALSVWRTRTIRSRLLRKSIFGGVMLTLCAALLLLYSADALP